MSVEISYTTQHGVDISSIAKAKISNLVTYFDYDLNYCSKLPEINWSTSPPDSLFILNFLKNGLVRPNVRLNADPFLTYLFTMNPDLLYYICLKPRQNVPPKLLDEEFVFVMWFHHAKTNTARYNSYPYQYWQAFQAAYTDTFFAQNVLPFFKLVLKTGHLTNLTEILPEDTQVSLQLTSSLFCKNLPPVPVEDFVVSRNVVYSLPEKIIYYKNNGPKVSTVPTYKPKNNVVAVLTGNIMPTTNSNSNMARLEGPASVRAEAPAFDYRAIKLPQIRETIIKFSFDMLHIHSDGAGGAIVSDGGPKYGGPEFKLFAALENTTDKLFPFLFVFFFFGVAPYGTGLAPEILFNKMLFYALESRQLTSKHYRVDQCFLNNVNICEAFPRNLFEMPETFKEYNLESTLAELSDRGRISRFETLPVKFAQINPIILYIFSFQIELFFEAMLMDSTIGNQTFTVANCIFRVKEVKNVWNEPGRIFFKINFKNASNENVFSDNSQLAREVYAIVGSNGTLRQDLVEQIPGVADGGIRIRSLPANGFFNFNQLNKDTLYRYATVINEPTGRTSTSSVEIKFNFTTLPASSKLNPPAEHDTIIIKLNLK